jgi:hypothetical protein
MNKATRNEERTDQATCTSVVPQLVCTLPVMKKWK